MGRSCGRQLLSASPSFPCPAATLIFLFAGGPCPSGSEDGVTRGLLGQSVSGQDMGQCGRGGASPRPGGRRGSNCRPHCWAALVRSVAGLLRVRMGGCAPHKGQEAAAGGSARHGTMPTAQRAGRAWLARGQRSSRQGAQGGGGCYRTAVLLPPPPKQAPKQEKRPPPLPRFSPCRRVAPELAAGPFVTGGTPRLGGGLSNGGPEPSSHRHIRSARRAQPG